MGNLTANSTLLVVEPAAAVRAAPGYKALPWRNGTALAVELGALMYDQPRHLLLKTTGPVTVSVEVCGTEVASQAGARDLA